jgi:hypothetical protein
MRGAVCVQYAIYLPSFLANNSEENRVILMKDHGILCSPGYEVKTKKQKKNNK